MLREEEGRQLDTLENTFPVPPLWEDDVALMVGDDARPPLVAEAVANAAA